MEQPLVQSSSGFEPITVDVPVKIGGGGERKQKQRENNRHWSCFQNSVSSQAMIHNYMNFKSSDSPARLMQWSDSAWVELSSDALSEAKLAFADRRPMVEMKLDGNDYIFDFFRMLQIDVGSELQRSIAWIDIKGDCYFPKFFVDESLIGDENDDDDEGFDDACVEAAPKIEIEIRVHSNSGNDKDSSNGKGKRKVRDRKMEAENEDTAASSCNNAEKGNPNPKRQLVVPPVVSDVGAMTWPNARFLGEGERAFTIVRDLFMSGMRNVDPSVRITNIRQFTRNGPFEKAQSEAFHKQMEMTEAARGRSNTVFAWYGTSKKGVFEILAHGFGWPSKVSGPQRAHGVGVYFAPARLPQLSDMLSEMDDDGEKHLVLCRVILGNIEKVEAGSEQFHPSSTAFDSGADDLVNPKRYIVWSTNMNTHILPECVVSYKSSNGQNGETMGVELSQWIPNGTSSVVAQLFSKLGSLLPAPKVEEMKALCMTYKAGKMAKDSFIKQLRFVVGNEILQSAISDIQGSK